MAEVIYPGYMELEGKEWVKTGEFRLARVGEAYLSSFGGGGWVGAYRASLNFRKVKTWILTQLFRDTAGNGWVLTGEERFLEKGDFWLEPYVKVVFGPSVKVGGLVRKIVKRWPPQNDSMELRQSQVISELNEVKRQRDDAMDAARENREERDQARRRERALKAEYLLAVGREGFKEKLATIEKLIEQVQVNSDRARGQERQNEVLLEDVIKIAKEGLNAK